ncbi:MAG: hypothetical protein ACLSCU_04685 [Eubacterium sp.]
MANLPKVLLNWQKEPRNSTNKGIKKLSDTYNDDIKTAIDRFKEVVNVGKEYKSFSGINSKMDGEVKFIIETEAVKNE